VPRSPSSIGLATSLAPGRTDQLQRLAVDSWRAAGFSVVSVNVPTEIELLRSSFPDVEFVAAARSGQKIAGKPVPFLIDLLRAAAARPGNAAIVGTINADIVLRAGTRLHDTVDDSVGPGVIMLPRVDIPDISRIPSGLENPNPAISIGYDGAFDARPLVEQIPDSAYCLGMPFWDYWLPMMAILKAWPLSAIASPEAFHQDHRTTWNQTVYFYFHALVSDLIAACRGASTEDRDADLALIVDVFANVYGKIFAQGTDATKTGAEADARRRVLADAFDSVQEVVVHHIKQRARPLAVPAPE